YGREDPARIFPARWGYYVGLRIMQRLGKDRTLRDLDHLANGPAKVLLAGELTKMIGEAGGCPGD
ncbi:MAG: hypothetical protein ACTHM8_03715, partial [Sphingomonas sp.]